MKRPKFQLTPSEREQLKELFHKDRDHRAKERYQAVLLRDKCYKIPEIAEIVQPCLPTGRGVSLSLKGGAKIT